MSGDLPTLERLEALGPMRAAVLWLEHLRGGDTDGDNPLLRQWLGAGEANRLAWARALELWDDFDEADDGTFEEMRRDALRFRPRRALSPWIAWSAAASLVLAVSAWGLFHIQGGDRPRPGQFASPASGPDPASFGMADYITRIGEQSTVSLTDGSKLTLDTDSAVDIAFSKGQRLARLVRGQALFEVAHDPAHPFRVAAGGRVISVLGTRFNIKLSPAEMRVSLAKGLIAVAKGDDPARPDGSTERLAPGQQLIVHAGRSDAIASFDAKLETEWTRGFIEFDHRSLASAVEEMNRYAARKLVVRDPKVSALRVSGAFPTNDTKGFVAALSALYPVKAVPMADGSTEIAYRR